MFVSYDIERVGEFDDFHDDSNSCRVIGPDEDIEELEETEGLGRVFWTLYGRRSFGGHLVADAIHDFDEKGDAVRMYEMLTGNHADDGWQDTLEPMLSLPARNVRLEENIAAISERVHEQPAYGRMYEQTAELFCGFPGFWRWAADLGNAFTSQEPFDVHSFEWIDAIDTFVDRCRKIVLVERRLITEEEMQDIAREAIEATTFQPAE